MILQYVQLYQINLKKYLPKLLFPLNISRFYQPRQMKTPEDHGFTSFDVQSIFNYVPLFVIRMKYKLTSKN